MWILGEEVRRFGVIVDNFGPDGTEARRHQGTKGRKMLKIACGRCSGSRAQSGVLGGIDGRTGKMLKVVAHLLVALPTFRHGEVHSVVK